MYWGATLNSVATRVMFQDYTLLVPAVGLGNVGQLAIDLILNTNPKTEHIRPFKTRHVLPIVGNDPLGEGCSGSMATCVELYRLSESKVCIMQIRAPVLDGHAQLFADEMVNFALNAKMSKIAVVGAADSSAGFAELGVQLHNVAYYSASSIKESRISEFSNKGMTLIDSSSPLARSGLLQKVSKACEKADIEMEGLVLFCKEGINVPEACMLGAAINTTLIVDVVPQLSRWQPPAAWAALEGPHSAPSLFH